MFKVNYGCMDSMHYTNGLCSLELLSNTLFSMGRFINNSILYCVVLYCIMRPYTVGQLDRYHIGIPRENPKSALNLG